MNFIETLEKETSGTYTENGQYAISTTTNHLLDLYSVVGALRDADDERIIKLFDKAVAEDKLLAAKIMFHCRDIREGIGERRVFRVLLQHAANTYPEMVIPNIPLIGYYGRFDDMYSLIRTKCEHEMWKAMKEQFSKDLENMKNNKPVSLLAKWIKTPDASSDKTRALGVLTSYNLGYKCVGDFKKDLKPLRKYLNIVEIAISANNFDTIAYDKVPSNAMLKYEKLFYKKNYSRFKEYIDEVKAGTKKINAGTLYPYNIVQKVFKRNYDETVELQWQNLPNYIEDGSNILIMADVSGSMQCCNALPIASSIGLAIYFSERAKGVFHNKFLTFSASPKLEEVVGESLEDKIYNLNQADWGMNTNLEAAMRVILKAAKESHAKQEEIPKALVIVSDMEIDCAISEDDRLFYDLMKEEYKEAGYELPNIIFWNVNSRSDVFHVTCDIKGVQLVSGHSASTFKNLLACLNQTPVEAMLNVLLSERYEPVTVG